MRFFEAIVISLLMLPPRCSRATLTRAAW